MKDIKNAILAEQQYIIDSYYNPHISIIDYLGPYGYTDLDEYFNDKNLALINETNFKLYLNEPTQNIDKRVWQAIANNENCIWVPQLEKVLACVGTDNFDYELAKELDVGILEMPHNGGTIITGPEDLTIGIHFTHPNSDWVYNYFFEKLKNYLEPHGFTYNANDFMYNGKKVIGCSAFRNGGNMAAFFFSVTFSDHTELINKLCQKRSEKIPGYIPKGVISKEQLLQEVLGWLKIVT